MLPLEELCLYTPRRDVLPRGSVNTDLPTGFSTKIKLWGFSPQRFGIAVPGCGVTLLENKCESNSVAEIFPSRRLSP